MKRDNSTRLSIEPTKLIRKNRLQDYYREQRAEIIRASRHVPAKTAEHIKLPRASLIGVVQIFFSRTGQAKQIDGTRSEL